MDTYFQQFIAICMNCTHIHTYYKTKAYKGSQNGPPYMLIIGNIYEIDVILTYGSSGCHRLRYLCTCSWLY